MIFDTDGLKSIISGWSDIRSVWNDRKSEFIEDSVISRLEEAVRDLTAQADEIALLIQNTEDELENIERTGDLYGW